MVIKKIKRFLSNDDWKQQRTHMRFHHEMTKFTKAFRDNFITLIISSLGLLVALSWNNFWTTWELR